MAQVVTTFLFAFAVWCASSPAPGAPHTPQGTSPGAKPETIKACSLLTREEVKKFVPWDAMFDQFPSREEPLGTYGSACSYPGTHIQVMTFSQGTLDAARKKGDLEPVAGVGDETYLYENPNGYAELYARVGKHLLTIQKSVREDENMASVKPGLIGLAKALAAKLR